MSSPAINDSGLMDKVAIVTGGSGGIGRAIVQVLAAAGMDVIFTYRGNAASVTEITAANPGAKISGAAVDIRDSAACAAFAEKIFDRTGRIDVLVNNAGVIRDNPLTAMEDDDVKTVLETNVTGTFNMTGRPTTLGATLGAAGDAEVVYVARSEAEARGVEPSAFAWSVPEDRGSLWDVDISRALAAGLQLRPIEETVRDTVAWHRSREGHEWKAGLSPEQEARLLA